MNRVKGFTLIELLVALFVFVVTMTVAVYGLLQLTKNRGSYHKKQEDLIEFQNAMILMQFDFMQINPRFIINDQNQIDPVFLGNVNEIKFNKIGYYNEQVHYYLKESDLYRNNQLLLSAVSNVEFNFIDNKGKIYALWPPVQEWAYQPPSGVKLLFETKRYGKIEKWAQVINE
jgi:prepilin-type N-terminal cleavage/methylation domain-containing protein